MERCAFNNYGLEPRIKFKAWEKQISTAFSDGIAIVAPVGVCME